MSARAEDKRSQDPSSHVRIRATQPAGSNAPPRVRPEESIVVVGGGIAGHALCRAVEGMPPSKRPQVTIVSEESTPPYDRVRLSQAISEPHSQSLQLATPSWYPRHGIVLHVGQRATEIDRKAGCVVTARGEVIPYDRLVLATGSQAIRPPIPGLDDPRCFAFRSLEDVQALSDAMDTSVASAVIGGGLLGLEAAKVLLERGHRVHVIEAGDRLMPRQLDGAGAAALQGQIEAMGVRVYTRERVAAVEREGGRLRLLLGSGGTLTVDLVVLAAGVRPRDELALAAGLECDPRGGVVVDDLLRTSDPAVYAIGECVRHRGVTYGLAAPCNEMARAVAQTFFVRPTQFERGDVSCRLKVVGVDVSAVGDYEGRYDRIAATGMTGSRVLLVDSGRLVGAVSVGTWPGGNDVELAVARRAKVSRSELDAFRKTGDLWKARGPVRPSSWPRATIVCACSGATVGDILELRTRGVWELEAIAKATGATTGCGSCQPLVQLLLSRSASDSGPRALGLLALSVAALALGIAIGLGPRVRMSTHAVETWQRLDWFWRSHTLKQVTGFVAIGLLLPGFLLTLKKRLRWPGRGSVHPYRVVHAAVGMLALIALVLHTGLRLGANLNLMLMSVFLAANVSGAFVGVLASLESRALSSAARFARRFRGQATLVHVLLLWPLPVLLALHVLAAFYF